LPSPITFENDLFIKNLISGYFKSGPIVDKQDNMSLYGLYNKLVVFQSKTQTVWFIYYKSCSRFLGGVPHKVHYTTTGCLLAK